MFDAMTPNFQADGTPDSPRDDDLLTGAALRSALGFRTGEAFRAAMRAKRIPVPLVKIAGRRGWFARAQDVTRWRSSLGTNFEQAARMTTMT